MSTTHDRAPVRAAAPAAVPAASPATQPSTDHEGPTLHEHASPPTPLQRSQSALRRLATPLVRRAVAAVAAGAVLGLGVGVVYGVLNPRQVSASLDVLVDSNVSLTGDLQVFEVTDREVATQQTMLGSAAVAQAASRATGLDLGRASVASAQNSDVITVSTVQPTQEQASRAVTAYVDGYFAMVADKQRGQLQGALAGAQGSAQAATEALAALDAALAALPADERSDALQRQSSQRDSFAEQQRTAAQQEQRLQASLASLPVNVALVDSAPDLESTGLSPLQTGLIGGLLGGTVALLVVLRVLERRREPRPAR